MYNKETIDKTSIFIKISIAIDKFNGIFKTSKYSQIDTYIYM